MSNVTFKIAAERAITHERIDVSVVGEQHGPFAVHLCPFALERTWVVTHVSTGRKVASGPTRHSARHAAALLQQLDVDWSFTDVASARAIPEEIQAQIQVIRVACAAGGEA